jgi:hypothetical protein
MFGDVSDFIRRMLAVLPNGWFADSAVPPQPATYLQAVLAGFGTAWAAIYNLISTVRLLTRLATVSGPFLDMASIDFFGNRLPRRPQESDGAFRLRVHQELLRPRATRSALGLALTELTGTPPTIFEPARPADTGGYSTGGLGYSTAGGWGNLALRYASFVTVTRPAGGGIARFAGYGTGGLLYYGDLSMVTTPVTDADIYATVTAILPAGYIAWTRIAG